MNPFKYYRDFYKKADTTLLRLFLLVFGFLFYIIGVLFSLIFITSDWPGVLAMITTLGGTLLGILLLLPYTIHLYEKIDFE